MSEGMALGLVMCGRESLPSKKVDIDLSFEGAWRTWIYNTQFPRVSTDIRNGLAGSLVMTHAEEQQHVLNLYWEIDGPEILIRRRAYWADGIDAAELVRTIDGDVPEDGWEALAKEFLDRFERYA